MKNLLLLLLLCSLSICTNAQKIRFTDSTNVWRVAESVGAYTYYTYFFGPDSVIGDKHYRPLIRSYISDSGDTLIESNQYMVREDTTTGRVYYRDISFGVDATDRLLYRYDLQLGDTVHFDFYTDSVSKVDSILIVGYYYKVFTLQDVGEPFEPDHYYTYIEGIGTLQGPRYAINPTCFFEHANALCCFQHNGSYPNAYLEYQNCWYDWIFENGDCNCSLPPYVGISSVPNTNLKPKVIPNPLQPSSLLEWNEPIENGLLRVTDATGRIILTREIRNSSSIHISQLLKEAGIYFYELTDIKNKRTAHGQIIVL